MLPNMIFFTGVPGSRWSGIAREIKSSGDYDCTDRAPHRSYTHNEFAGHLKPTLEQVWNFLLILIMAT